MRNLCLALSIGAAFSGSLPIADKAGKLADTYVEAVEKVNADHARRPKSTEVELREALPAKASKALAKLLEHDGDAETLAALRRAGEAALDLDRVGDFDRVRGRMAEIAPGSDSVLGVALSRDRFLLRGLGGLDVEYLETFADVFEAVLEAYDEVFGFEELSKVPGKKLRVRVHLEAKIERPPHFAPQYRWHSEIDFPVVDAREFRSPTDEGKFLFYGLCHELGHVVAMWGRQGLEEDHHAWAHYTGVVIVDHVARQELPALSGARDVHWRSVAKLREEVGDTEPGTESRTAVLALLLRLHDELGPRAIGEAINELDAADDRLRINRVRYYTFDELREGLLEVEKDRTKRRLVKELLD